MNAAGRAYIVAALLFAACGEEDPPPDGGVFEDAAPDAGPPDAGHDDAMPLDLGPQDGGPTPDAGRRFNTSTCLPCSMSCTGGTCLTNPTTNETFCADDCDEDLFGCVTGFTCLDIDPDEMVSQSFCVPPGASCTTLGVGYGAECHGDTSTCLQAQHFCEGDRHALGFCTEACGVDADCPPGYRCAPGDDGEAVCKPAFLSAAERCAREDPAEVPCAVDLECDGIPGAICIRSEPSLPGVCAVTCHFGACPTGTCVETYRGPACLSDTCACHGTPAPAGTRDLLGEALASVGLSRCSTTFSVFDWASTPPSILADPYRLSFFDAIHNEPLRAPAFAKRVVASLDEDDALVDHPATRAARMIEHLAELTDRPAVPHAPGTIDPVEPLATAIAELITLTGGVPDEPALRAAAAALPMELALGLARIVEAMQRAVVARRNAIETAMPGAEQTLYDFGAAFLSPRADGRGLAPEDAATRTLLNETFQYGEMYGGAVDVLDAIAAAELERFAAAPTGAPAPPVYLFSVETPIGRIAVADGEPSLYDSTRPEDAGPWALLVDLGGDDVYDTPVAGNTSAANVVSIAVDLGGDDRYAYVEVPDPRDATRLPSDGGGRYAPRAGPDRDLGPISFSQIPRQGGARVGTAILVDRGAGRDHYQSLRMSQGAGIFGTGVLIDDGGDDVYLAESMAQGAGEFGIGLLYDLGGDDERRAYAYAQGFAYARAAGLLYDTAGADRYLMDVGDPAYGGDPLYFSIQRPGTSNPTLGQGFGFGRRDDETGAYMSGGIGVLVDRDGNDRYQGSIFAQGGGYWFGTGILADRAGDDRYDAMWYGMASGAHYALGFLLDAGGNDWYGGELPRVNVTIAGGHDYSAAFLIDEEGTDIYDGSRISMGAGNSNGMGFFVDNGGDDTYAANGAFSFGAAGLLGRDVDFPGSPRRSVDVIGIFIDAGGFDDYRFSVAGLPSNLGIGDNESWVLTQNMNPLVNRIEKGAGVDGEGESTLHAR